MDHFYEIVGHEGTNYQGFILKDVDLSKRTFPFKMDFTSARFIGQVKLLGTLFTDVAVFKDVIFEKDVLLKEARFKREAVFTGSIFEGDFQCREVRFDGKAYFKRIRFKDAHFPDTIFGDKCTFSPKVQDLENMTPTFENADFSGTHFDKGGSLDHCIIPKGSFEDSSIQNVSFREVNLDEVRFAGAQMDFAYLADSEWTVDLHGYKYQNLLNLVHVSDPRLVIREELEAREIPKENGPEKGQAYKKAESTYRRIKHSLANEGAYEKAGEFYIHEMRMKRERYAVTTGALAKWNYLWNILYSWTCGYGERPKRVFLNAFIIILIFSFLYAGFDGIQKSGVADGDSYDPSFRECLYFSVVTFTTLGYGDYSPKSSFQLLAVSEAFLGAFTIALFVLVFGRKVMR